MKIESDHQQRLAEHAARIERELQEIPDPPKAPAPAAISRPRDQKGYRESPRGRLTVKLKILGQKILRARRQMNKTTQRIETLLREREALKAERDATPTRRLYRTVEDAIPRPRCTRKEET